MKWLLFLICLYSVQTFAQGEFQRLGLLPTNGPIKFTKANSNKLPSICTDNGRGAALASDKANFKYVHSAGEVEATVNGRLVEGGLSALLAGANPILKAKVDGTEAVQFVINPARNDIKEVTINVKKLAVIGNKENDLIGMNADIITKNYPELFKRSYGDLQNSYWRKSTAIDIARKSGEIKFENGLLTNHSMAIINNYDDILNGTSNAVLFSNKNIVTETRIVKLGNKLQAWTIEDGYKIYEIRNLETSDIILSEYYYDEGLKSYGSLLSDEKIYYCHVSSIDKKGYFKFCINDKETVINVGVPSFEKIVDDISKSINDLPVDGTIILARDDVQRSILTIVDKTDINQLYGDKFINPSMVPELSWVNNSELYRALKEKFPHRRFYLGGNLSEDLDRLDKIKPVSSPKDIVAFMAPKSFEIKWDAISSLRSTFKQSDIRVVEMEIEDVKHDPSLSEANVILLSGHKNENFQKYLIKLKEEGLLRRKVIAVFSCNESGTTHLNSFLTSGENGALKVIFFPSRINVNATKAVLTEFAAITKNITEQSATYIDRLFDKAIDNALQNPEYENLRPEIKRFKEYIGQLTQIQPLKNNNNGKAGA